MGDCTCLVHCACLVYCEDHCAHLLHHYCGGQCASLIHRGGHCAHLVYLGATVCASSTVEATVPVFSTVGPSVPVSSTMWANVPGRSTVGDTVPGRSNEGGHCAHLLHCEGALCTVGGTVHVLSTVGAIVHVRLYGGGGGGGGVFIDGYVISSLDKRVMKLHPCNNLVTSLSFARNNFGIGTVERVYQGCNKVVARLFPWLCLPCKIIQCHNKVVVWISFDLDHYYINNVMISV